MEHTTPDDVLTWLHLQVRRPTRVDVASRYAAMLTTYWGRMGDLHCTSLNMAIANRWSMSGLQWIKMRAWSAAEQWVKVQNQIAEESR